jgi:hypothetical protein
MHVKWEDLCKWCLTVINAHEVQMHVKWED